MARLKIFLLLLFFLFGDIWIKSDYWAQQKSNTIPPLVSKDFYRGLTMLSHFQYASAVIQFRSILKKTKGFILPRIFLSDALYFSGFWSEALKEVEVLTDILGQQRARLLRRNFLPRTVFTEDTSYVILEDDILRLQHYGQPVGISVNDRNKLWVADAKNQAVQLIDASGRLEKKMSGPWYSPLKNPVAVISVEDQTVFVCDFQEDQVVVFDRRGRFIRSFGGRGIQPGRFYGPRDITADDKNLYVLDIGNHRIQKFSQQGQFLSFFGKETLVQPTSIAFDEKKAFLYVADPAQKKIFVFTRHGKKMAAYGEGILEDPLGITIHKNFLFVADKEKGILILNLLTSEWFTLKVFRQQGDSKSLRVFSPQDIAINSQGVIFIASPNYNQILTLATKESGYSNIEIRILRVRPEAFPQIILEVSVQDLMGNHLSSLSNHDFTIFENLGKVPKFNFSNISEEKQNLLLTIIREDTLAFKERHGQLILKLAEENILPHMRKYDRVQIVVARDQKPSAWKIYLGNGKRDILYYLDRYSVEVKKDRDTIKELSGADWLSALELGIQGSLRESGMRNVLLIISGDRANLLQGDSVQQDSITHQAKLMRLIRFAMVHQVRLHVFSFESAEGLNDKQKVREFFTDLVEQTDGHYFSAKEFMTKKTTQDNVVKKSNDLYSTFLEKKRKSYQFSYTSPNGTVSGYQRVTVEAKHLNTRGAMNSGYIVP